MGPPRIAQDAIAMAEHATHTDNPREPSAFDRERPHSLAKLRIGRAKRCETARRISVAMARESGERE